MSVFDEFGRNDGSIVIYQPPTTDARPLNDVQRIKSAFIRTCGEKVQADHRLRIGESADFERFAREHSIRFEHFLSNGENQYGWIQAIRTKSGYEVCLCSKMFESDGEAARELARLEDVDSSGRSTLSHTNRIVTDGGENKLCAAVECDNPPIERGYCRVCLDISPGILDSASDEDDTDAPEERPLPSEVSDETDDPEHDADESPDSGSHSRAQDSSDDANPGFETGKSAAHKQNHAAVPPQHAPNERGQRGGLG